MAKGSVRKKGKKWYYHRIIYSSSSTSYLKDVQELLGLSDVSTTINVYAHSTRKAKRNSARLLDKVAGND